MTEQKVGLWNHPDFVKLWVGQTISLFGSEITGLAFGLIAVLILHATPEQMGILGMLRWMPYLLFGLLVGAWVDRMRKRQLLIFTDIIRGILLLLIPFGIYFNFLRIEHLFLVAFVYGVFSIFFEAAYQAYLPSLVKKEELVEGNSKLEVSRSIAQITGSGIGGAVIQVLTAPVAIIIDALSFFISAFSIALIPSKEQLHTIKDIERKHILHEIHEGLVFVYGNPILRAISLSTVTHFLFYSAISAIYVLYFVRDLGITPLQLGLIYAVGGIGSFIGAYYAGSISKRIGIGKTIILAKTLFIIGVFFVAVAAYFKENVMVFLFLAQFVASSGAILQGVNELALRQSITPSHLLGRMNATMRSFNWGTGGIGALLGGFLGSVIGLKLTIILCAAGFSLSILWLLFSPVITFSKIENDQSGFEPK